MRSCCAPRCSAAPAASVGSRACLMAPSSPSRAPGTKGAGASSSFFCSRLSAPFSLFLRAEPLAALPGVPPLPGAAGAALVLAAGMGTWNVSPAPRPSGMTTRICRPPGALATTAWPGSTPAGTVICIRVGAGAASDAAATAASFFGAAASAAASTPASTLVASSSPPPAAPVPAAAAPAAPAAPASAASASAAPAASSLASCLTPSFASAGAAALPSSSSSSSSL